MKVDRDFLSRVLEEYELSGKSLSIGLEEFLEDAERGKERIVRFLGSDTIDFAVDLRASTKELERLVDRYGLREALGGYGYEEVIENRLGDGRKLSKVIGESDGWLAEKYCRLRAEAWAEGRLGSTCSALELLLISESAKFRTCHSIDGDYSAGNFAYAVDRHTLVAYYYKSEKRYLGRKFPYKLWRMLAYVDLEHGAIVFSRQYPRDRMVLCNAVKAYLFERFMRYFGVDGADIVKLPEVNFDNDSGAYIDYEYFDAYKLRAVSEEAISFYIDDYGYVTSEEMDYCSSCGERFPAGELRYFDGEYFCESCYEELIGVCDFCEDEAYWSDLHRVYDRGKVEHVCGRCFSRYYERCRVCGGYFYENGQYYRDKNVWRGRNGYWVNEVYYCEDCFNREIERCAGCGRYMRVERMDLVGDELYCEECREEVGKCAKCGRVILRYEDWGYGKGNRLVCGECMGVMHED